MNIADIVLAVQLFIEFLNPLLWRDLVNCFVCAHIEWRSFVPVSNLFEWRFFHLPSEFMLLEDWKGEFVRTLNQINCILAALSSSIVAFLSNLCVIRVSQFTLFFFVFMAVAACSAAPDFFGDYTVPCNHYSYFFHVQSVLWQYFLRIITHLDGFEDLQIRIFPWFQIFPSNVTRKLNFMPPKCYSSVYWHIGEVSISTSRCLLFSVLVLNHLEIYKDWFACFVP